MPTLLRSVELPIELTNGNDGRGNHWFRTATVRKSIEATLRKLEHTYRPFAVPVRLRITRLLGKRQQLWDYDSGLRGNSKELIDAMVVCGWFRDDKPKWIRGVDFEQVSQTVTKRVEPAVLVEVFSIT